MVWDHEPGHRQHMNRAPITTVGRKKKKNKMSGNFGHWIPLQGSNPTVSRDPSVSPIRSERNRYLQTANYLQLTLHFMRKNLEKNSKPRSHAAESPRFLLNHLNFYIMNW